MNFPDPPIKRFAQRHSYLAIDGIANRDIGFAVTRQNALTRTVPVPTVIVHSSTPGSGSNSTNLSQTQMNSSFSSKRPSSPDRSLRLEESKNSDQGFGPPHKRSRDISPPRERERWAGTSKERRYGSPAWERERERERSPPRRTAVAREKEEPKKLALPQVLSWFIGTLPPPSSFDGTFK